MTRSFPLAAAAILLLATSPSLPLHAGSLTGPVAKSDFQSWATNHAGTFLNFNGLLSGSGLEKQWLSRFGVRFATTSDAEGRPLSNPTPVVVSASYAYSLGRLTIVGSPCRGCSDERACDYAVEFARPQRWAGIQRYWRGPTLTRFVAPDGDVLHEAEGEGFHGWLSDADDPDTWVARIEISGRDQNGSRQVGYSDDLTFGTNAIPRVLSYLSLRATSGAVLEGLQRPRRGIDYGIRSLGDTNEWFVGTGTNRSIGMGTNRPARLPKGDLLLDLE